MFRKLPSPPSAPCPTHRDGQSRPATRPPLPRDQWQAAQQTHRPLWTAGPTNGLRLLGAGPTQNLPETSPQPDGHLPACQTDFLLTTRSIPPRPPSRPGPSLAHGSTWLRPASSQAPSSASPRTQKPRGAPRALHGTLTRTTVRPHSRSVPPPSPGPVPGWPAAPSSPAPEAPRPAAGGEARSGASPRPSCCAAFAYPSPGAPSHRRSARVGGESEGNRGERRWLRDTAIIASCARPACSRDACP